MNAENNFLPAGEQRFDDAEGYERPGYMRLLSGNLSLKGRQE